MTDLQPAGCAVDRGGRGELERRDDVADAATGFAVQRRQRGPRLVRDQLVKRRVDGEDVEPVRDDRPQGVDRLRSELRDPCLEQRRP